MGMISDAFRYIRRGITKKESKLDKEKIFWIKIQIITALNLIVEFFEILVYNHSAIEDNLETAKAYVKTQQKTQKTFNIDEQSEELSAKDDNFHQMQYSMIEITTMLLTVLIIARFIIFLLSFMYKRLSSVMIFIEVLVVLCNCAIPIAPLPSDKMHLQDLTRLLIFQFLCYNWNCTLGCILLFCELCAMLFVLEPLMHTEAVHISARILMIAFYLFALVPVFIYSEWCIIQFFNEFVRKFQKHEDYQTLIDKTGNPLFVIKGIKNGAASQGQIIYQNQQALKFLSKLNILEVDQSAHLSHHQSFSSPSTHVTSAKASSNRQSNANASASASTANNQQGITNNRKAIQVVNVAERDYPFQMRRNENVNIPDITCNDVNNLGAAESSNQIRNSVPAAMQQLEDSEALIGGQHHSSFMMFSASTPVFISYDNCNASAANNESSYNYQTSRSEFVNDEEDDNLYSFPLLADLQQEVDKLSQSHQTNLKSQKLLSLNQIIAECCIIGDDGSISVIEEQQSSHTSSLFYVKVRNNTDQQQQSSQQYSRQHNNFNGSPPSYPANNLHQQQQQSAASQQSQAAHQFPQSSHASANHNLPNQHQFQQNQNGDNSSSNLIAVRLKLSQIKYEQKDAIVVEIQNAEQEMAAIHNLQKYDNLLKMTRQLETLYQTVSHEMRTPLNGIQQSVTQLLSIDLNAMPQRWIKHQLKLLYFQSNLLECFVNDQLDLKMIQAGVYKQNISIFDPKSVIKLVKEMFKDQAQAQQTKILFIIESAEQQVVQEQQSPEEESKIEAPQTMNESGMMGSQQLLGCQQQSHQLPPQQEQQHVQNQQSSHQQQPQQSSQQFTPPNNQSQHHNLNQQLCMTQQPTLASGAASERAAQARGRRRAYREVGGANNSGSSSQRNNQKTDAQLPLLLGDKRRLQQVLINLVKNSLKFTHEGVIKIKAGYNRQLRRLNVKICDTGIGISMEDQKKLFKTLGKLKNSNTSLNRDGIGLGLTICEALVTQNGGKIQVQSGGLGKGTTFEFYFQLDYYEDDGNSTMQQENNNDCGGATTSKRKARSEFNNKSEAPENYMIILGDEHNNQDVNKDFTDIQNDINNNQHQDGHHQSAANRLLLSQNHQEENGLEYVNEVRKVQRQQQLAASSVSPAAKSQRQHCLSSNANTVQLNQSATIQDMISEDIDDQGGLLNQNLTVINKQQIVTAQLDLSILKEDLNNAQVPQIPQICRQHNDTPVTLTDHQSRVDKRSQFTFREEQEEVVNDQDMGFFQLSYTQPCDARAADTVRNMHHRLYYQNNQSQNVFKTGSKRYNEHRAGISRTARVSQDKIISTSKEDTGSLMITQELNAIPQNRKDEEFNNALHQLDIDTKAEILVIDDSQFNLMAAKLLLSQFGLSCDLAISGKKGIKLFKQRLEMQRENAPQIKPLQLIFLDYEMPIMDGEAVMAELVKIFEEEEARPGSDFFRPKICCMSAHIANNIRQRAFEVGMDDYLTKPTGKNEMDLILKRYYRPS